jgi:hypothetical protein
MVLLLQGCAIRSPYEEVSDPLEPVNRAIYTFNDTFDRYLLRWPKATRNMCRPWRAPGCEIFSPISTNR